MKNIDLASLPDMVLDNNEPVFNEPWEAQAFAMVVNLHQNGAFTWTEWAHQKSPVARSCRKNTTWTANRDSARLVFQRQSISI